MELSPKLKPSIRPASEAVFAAKIFNNFKSRGDEQKENRPRIGINCNCVISRRTQGGNEMRKANVEWWIKKEEENISKIKVKLYPESWDEYMGVVDILMLEQSDEKI